MINLEPALIALARHDADVVIIGGVATLAHGSAMSTNDLDVCYSLESANLERLASALAPFHPRLRDLPAGLPFLWDVATLRSGSLFTLTTDLGDIDLLAEVAGVGGYPEVKAASVPMDMFGYRFAVLSLDALIASKRAIGRTKDLLVLPELEALREATREG